MGWGGGGVGGGLGQFLGSALVKLNNLVWKIVSTSKPSASFSEIPWLALIFQPFQVEF